MTERHAAAGGVVVIMRLAGTPARLYVAAGVGVTADVEMAADVQVAMAVMRCP